MHGGKLELKVLPVKGYLHHIADGEIHTNVLMHVRVLLLLEYFVAFPEILIDKARSAFMLPIPKTMRAGIDSVQCGDGGNVHPPRELDDIHLHREALQPCLERGHKAAEIMPSVVAFQCIKARKQLLHRVWKKLKDDADANVQANDSLPAIFGDLRRVEHGGSEKDLNCAQQTIAHLSVGKALQRKHTRFGFVLPRRHDCTQFGAKMLTLADNGLDFRVGNVLEFVHTGSNMHVGFVVSNCRYERCCKVCDRLACFRHCVRGKGYHAGHHCGKQSCTTGCA